MGQYHHIVSMEANESIDPHEIGNGLKAWDQTGGATPALLALLLSHNPGNMPADMGHHPMTGRWAGHRMLVVGDYAEAGDIRGFKGPRLDRIYGLCTAPPVFEEYLARGTRVYYRQGTKDSYSQSSNRWDFDDRKGRVREIVETPESRFNEAMKDFNKRTSNGKLKPFLSVCPQTKGALEYALSMRFCGEYKTTVPVKPYAKRGTDGHLHYRIADSVLRDDETRDYYLRMLGIGGYRDQGFPNPDLTAELQANGERWPWDRPPSDLSWHNAPSAYQDLGQTRVWANITRREFINPRAFGEEPTTIGIMRAANDECFASAGSVFAMLLHPHRRGGGDVSEKEFPEIGRWRNCHMVLTAERSTEEGIPSTDEVMETYTDISSDVVKAAANAMRQDAEA